MNAYRGALFAMKGMMEFTRQAYEARSKSWDPTALEVDMNGRVCVVSGANAGLGKETALALAERGAQVHMLCRNEERGREAAEEIRQITGNGRVDVHVVDVSRPAQIRDFAQSFLKDHPAVHVLVNNAGVLVNPRELTPEGTDVNFATNTLGTFALTNYLMPGLIKGGEENPEDPARIVVVSSGGMYTATLDIDDPECRNMEPYDGVRVYAQTKRQQVILTELWAQRLQERPVIVHSMHPGWAATPGVERSLPSFNERMANKLRTSKQGADTIVWLATAKEVLKYGIKGGGLFFLDREPVNTHMTTAWTQEKPETREELWKICARYTEADFTDW